MSCICGLTSRDPLVLTVSENRHILGKNGRGNFHAEKDIAGILGSGSPLRRAGLLLQFLNIPFYNRRLSELEWSMSWLGAVRNGTLPHGSNRSGQASLFRAYSFRSAGNPSPVGPLSLELSSAVPFDHQSRDLAQIFLSAITALLAGAVQYPDTLALAAASCVKQPAVA